MISVAGSRQQPSWPFLIVHVFYHAARLILVFCNGTVTIKTSLKIGTAPIAPCRSLPLLCGSPKRMKRRETHQRPIGSDCQENARGR